MANWKITRVNYKQEGDYRLISSLRWRADLYDSATNKSASLQGTTSVETAYMYYDSADTSVDSLGQQEYLDILFAQLGYDYIDGVSQQLQTKVAVSAPIAVAPAETTAASVPYDNSTADYWNARFDTLSLVDQKVVRYREETDLDSSTRIALINDHVGYIENEVSTVGSQYTTFGISLDSVNTNLTATKLIVNNLQDVYDSGWVVNTWTDSYYGTPSGTNDDDYFPSLGLTPDKQFIVTDSLQYNIHVQLTDSADSHPLGLSCYPQYSLDSLGVPLGDSEGSQYYLGYGYFGDSVGNADSLYNDSFYTAGFQCQPSDILYDNPELKQTKEMLGYFVPTYTGSHTFYTRSDDFSYLWIGDVAIAGYTDNNALVDNGGPHGSTEVGGVISLTAGEYYPIRVLYGNMDSGPGTITVSYEHTGQPKTENWTGVIQHNSLERGDVAGFRKGH